LSENEGPGGSFEDRLKTARKRQGLDAPETDTRAATSTSKQGSPLGLGMRVGVELVSALIVAVAIGWALDRWLHTLPLFLVIFVLLGGVAGIANVWRLVGPAKHS
jgi:ATP synthase protein I